MTSAAAVTYVEAVTYVVAVIVNGRDRVLMLKRSPDAGLGPGKWGLPGGRLLPGEEVSAGMRRELKEEVGGLRLRLKSRLGPIPGAGLIGARIHLFLFRHLDGEVALNAEHTAAAWVDREGLAGMDALPGVAEDIACFRVWPPR